MNSALDLTDSRILQNVANALKLMDNYRGSAATYRLSAAGEINAQGCDAKAAKVEAQIVAQTGKTIDECRELTATYTGIVR